MWIRNRTTTHRLNGRTPYEVLYGTKPEVGGIHLWGSRVWVRSLTAGKLDPRGREGRFVGYDTESKGCRVYWTDSRTIGVERDLIFEDRPMDDELISLPASSVTKNRPKTVPPVQPPSNEPTPQTPATSEVDENISPSDIPLPPPDEDELAEPNEETAASPESSPSTTNKDDVQTTRRSTRVRKPSPYVRKVLAGEVDAGTARGKSKLPKGLQVPSGLVATEEEEELESEPPIHFTLEI